MSAPHILVVDDEPDIRNLVHEILEDEGYEVQVAENAAAARQARRRRQPELILLDIWMPDIDGVSLLKEWTDEGGPGCPVVMISGHGTVETAVEATRLGAYDFVEKPLSLAKLLLTVQRALEAGGRSVDGEIAIPQGNAFEPVGRSITMRALREQARRVATLNSCVLIGGEAGSGKRCLARYLHACSPRAHKPLLEISLVGNRETALQALFGHEESGRVEPGYLEQADGGSIFFTEIAELDLEVQSALHSALQAGHFYRPNGQNPINVDARVLSSTQHDLEQEVRAGRFREDLYYLLNVVPLRVPALREHREDVPELLAFWVDQLVEREAMPYRHFTLPAQNRLRNHAWPGNVHELKNLVQRLLVHGHGEEISVPEVERELQSAPEKPALAAEELALPLDLPLRDAREQFERIYLQHQLKRAEGSVGQLAKLTGMERTHLYRKLKALGIDPKDIK